MRALPKNRRRMRYIVGSLLPVYLATWLCIVGCSQDFKRMMSCYAELVSFFNRVPQDGSVEAFNGLNRISGDVVFIWPADDASSGETADPRPEARWSTLGVTTAGIEMGIAKGTLEISGEVDPFSRSREAGSLPRKLILRWQLKNDRNRVVKKFQTKLKVWGDNIPTSRSNFPGFDIPAGHSVHLTTKQRGTDDGEEHQVQLFFDFQPDVGGGPPSFVGSVLGTPLPMPAVRLGETISAGDRQQLIDHEFFQETGWPQVTFVASGRYTTAARTGARGAVEAAPTRLDFRLRHFDEDGNRVKQYDFSLAVQNGTIPRKEINFPAFTFQPGHHLEIYLRPQGGDVEPADQVNLELTAY